MSDKNYYSLKTALQRKSIKEKHEFYNKMDVRNLWNFIGILKESEKEEVMSLLTDETVQKLKECTNPYRKPIYEPQGKFLEFSYINTEREYLQNLAITSMVGFVYKMATEYKPEHPGPITSEEDPEFLKLYNAAMVNFTCDKLSQYYEKQYNQDPSLQNKVLWLRAQTIVAERRKQPNKHLIEEAKTICIDNGFEYDELYPEEKPVQPEDMQEIKHFVKGKMGVTQTLEEWQEQIQDHLLDFLDYHFKYDPNNHIRCGYYPRYEPMMKKHGETPVPGETELVKTPRGTQMIVNDKFEKYLIPPHDTFAAFNSYFESNYEYLRECTDNIYFPALFECAVIPRESFENTEKAKRWEQKYAEDFDMSVMQIPFGRWTFIEPWQKNRNQISFDNEKTQIIQEILSRKKEDEKIGRKLLDKKAKKMKGRVTGDVPVESQLKDFGAEKVGKDELEIKVYETKLIRKPRAKGSVFNNWSFSVESEPDRKD